VKRVGERLGRQAVGFDRLFDVRTFEGKDDVPKAQMLQNRDVFGGAGDEELPSYFLFSAVDRFVEGTGVHADSDGGAVGFASLDHGFDFVFGTDVPRVDPDGIDPGGEGGEGKTVIQMNVRHQGNGDLLFDFLNGFGVFEIEHRDPHELGSQRRAAIDLG
jgi:hypothetical protein